MTMRNIETKAVLPRSFQRAYMLTTIPIGPTMPSMRIDRPLMIELRSVEKWFVSRPTTLVLASILRFSSSVVPTLPAPSLGWILRALKEERKGGSQSSYKGRKKGGREPAVLEKGHRQESLSAYGQPTDDP